MEQLLGNMATEIPTVVAIVVLVYFFLKHLKTVSAEQMSKDQAFVQSIERITKNSEEFSKIREERYIEHATELTTKYSGQMLRMVDELKESRRQGEAIITAVLNKKTGD